MTSSLTEHIISLEIAQRGTFPIDFNDCWDETFKEEILTREDGRLAHSVQQNYCISTTIYGVDVITAILLHVG